MEDQNSDTRSRNMMLTSPDGAPFPFTVIIRGAWPAHRLKLSFDIKGLDASTRSATIWRYHLDDREHNTYLDLFEELSADFGSRVPQNRKPLERPAFHANYREVLTENLAPGMIYGYGDPAVIRVEGNAAAEEPWYYLLATSNDAPDSFPIIRSRDLMKWEFVDYVFPHTQKPGWAADSEGIGDYWAPEMHKVGNEFRVYFVARDKLTRELCIGTARCSQPFGRFVADKAPVLRGNVIDPHVFVGKHDDAWLYWKEDNNEVWPRQLLDLLYERPELISTLFTGEEDQITASLIVTMWPWARILEPMERFQAIQVLIEAVTSSYKQFCDRLAILANEEHSYLNQRIGVILHHMKTPLFAQQLAPDGLSLVGNRTKIIENDLAWEAHLVEGMWVTEYRSKFYLFYAGNDFSTSHYGIGVAIADSPLGPFRKMERQLLQSTSMWSAPGHPSVVLAPDGKPHLFLHAYFPGKAGYKQFRVLLSIPVHLSDDEVRLGSIE